MKRKITLNDEWASKEIKSRDDLARIIKHELSIQKIGENGVFKKLAKQESNVFKKLAKSSR